jgi:hypothetical protein
MTADGHITDANMGTRKRGANVNGLSIADLNYRQQEFRDRPDAIKSPNRFHALNKINNEILSSWWLFAEKIEVTKSTDDTDVQDHLLNRAVFHEDDGVALFLKVVGIWPYPDRHRYLARGNRAQLGNRHLSARNIRKQENLLIFQWATKTFCTKQQNIFAEQNYPKSYKNTVNQSHLKFITLAAFDAPEAGL